MLAPARAELGHAWRPRLGFGITLTRRIAFAKGRSGSDPNVALDDATEPRLPITWQRALLIYACSPGLAFAVAFGLGFFYLRNLTLDAVALPSVWIAWGVLCLSQALTVWAAA